MTDLPSLKERIETAERPSKELDALILCALAAPKDSYVEQSPINGAWCIYEIGYGGKPRLWEWQGCASPALWPVTSSLDAALALVERIKPGWCWTLTNAYPDDDGIPRAWLWLGAQETNDGDVRLLRNIQGSGKTPALALLSALLTALTQSHGDENV